MSDSPLFSGEISIFDDQDTGLRVECSERHAAAISSYLAQRGFSCGTPEIVINGTARIHNFVQFSVSFDPFAGLKSAIADHLKERGVTTTLEPFNQPGEAHIRFNLTNVSVFDKV